jgi:thioredoxin reductase (NADPH)
MSSIHQVIIIGSGPAGYTAALYAARANLTPVLFKGSAPNLPGGQLMMTSEVENFPGFPGGLLGPELMAKFEEQAVRFGAHCIEENIIGINFEQSPFSVTSESGKIYNSKTIIIATGANAKLLGLPQEKELMAAGAGVSACATCDGAFYKNLEVAVIGGGDSALEEALFLTRFAKKVTIIHRREELRASKIMQNRAKNNPKIFWLFNQEVSKLLTKKTLPLNKEALCGLELKNTIDNAITNIDVEGLFVAIGHEPSTKLFKNSLALDQKGYIKTLGQSSKTEIAGVFACGDVQDSYYRQAITAAGSGCMAAIDAERYLESMGH